jgi:hypothetical protein
MSRIESYIDMSSSQTYRNVILSIITIVIIIVIIIIIIITIVVAAVQPFVESWPLFQLHNPIHNL